LLVSIIVWLFNMFISLYLYSNRLKVTKKDERIYIQYRYKLFMICIIVTVVNGVYLIFNIAHLTNSFVMINLGIVAFFVTYLIMSIKNYNNYTRGKEYIIYLQELKNRANNELEISIQEFYDGYVNQKESIKGVYVIRNKTKNKYYVGQSQNIVLRVRKHLEGSGNGHLFADYKYGDLFSVILIRFNTNKYTSLSHQERAYIEIFDSFNRGYNKTRGGS